MTVSSIVTALKNVVAAAVGARESYDDLTVLQPTALPAVVVAWESTDSEASAHGQRQAAPGAGTGKLTRKQVKRIHVGTLFILSSSTGNLPYEDRAVKEAVQALLDALDSDETLVGDTGVDQCAKCTLGVVNRLRVEIDGVVYHGVTSPWTAIEL
jgi:hypothetical protein